MIWFVLAFLTGAAVLCVLWPLSRGGAAPVSAGDADFYRHQLTEIDAEARRGSLAGEELAAARTDAARRLIAAAAAPDAPLAGGAAKNRRRAAALAAVILIPLVSLAVYAKTGSPGLADQPLQARRQAAPAELDMDAALARIETHLLQNPNDGQGYEVIAPIYLRLGRADDAVRAYANAIRLLGANPARQSAYGEALMSAAGGIVTSEAKAQFTAAAAADPKDAKARFFLGLAAEQEGDIFHARGIWTKLAADSAADAPWLPTVRRRLASLGQPQGAPPSGAAAAAISQLPAADQQAAIHGMVDGLAERLSHEGRDLPGWQRLVRAYTVLNEADKARSALGEARKNFAGDADALRALENLGRDLGLGAERR